VLGRAECGEAFDCAASAFAAAGPCTLLFAARRAGDAASASVACLLLLGLYIRLLFAGSVGLSVGCCCKTVHPKGALCCMHAMEVHLET
jgi:hypothetical protein